PSPWPPPSIPREQAPPPRTSGRPPPADWCWKRPAPVRPTPLRPKALAAMWQSQPVHTVFALTTCIAPLDPPIRGGSGYRNPAAIGIAAGRAASNLWFVVNVHSVSVLPAGHCIALVGGTRNDRTVAA